jgi:hypothetical protein
MDTVDGAPDEPTRTSFGGASPVGLKIARLGKDVDMLGPSAAQSFTLALGDTMALRTCAGTFETKLHSAK